MSVSVSVAGVIEVSINVVSVIDCVSACECSKYSEKNDFFVEDFF